VSGVVGVVAVAVIVVVVAVVMLQFRNSLCKGGECVSFSTFFFKVCVSCIRIIL